MSNSCSGDECSCSITRSNKLKKRSEELTSRPGDSKTWTKRAAARAMMRAVGYSTEDFEKPLICVASPFSDVSPCNAHIDELAKIAEAVHRYEHCKD